LAYFGPLGKQDGREGALSVPGSRACHAGSPAIATLRAGLSGRSHPVDLAAGRPRFARGRDKPSSSRPNGAPGALKSTRVVRSPRDCADAPP